MSNIGRILVSRHRAGVGLTTLALLIGIGLISEGRAQDEGADPPTRVGRIAILEGNVSFHPSPSDPWSDAAVNYPIAQAGQLWVEPGGRAEIGLGEARIRLDGGSELDIVQFDDQNVVLSVPQGRVDVFLRGRHAEERYLVETPRGNVEISQDGHYRVFAGTTDEPTRVAAFGGLAVIAEPQTQLSINRGEEAVISPSDPPSFSVSPATQDPFDHWGEERERRVTENVSSRYVSPDMPGAADLDQYGTWRDDPQYGHVWIPSGVEAGWAPYHNGHWASVQPWGWTWVDDAPWGFAPFHYGRWTPIGGGWGWIPGEITVHPVYAPALVAWVGDPGALVGVGIGGVSVGWIPLGPREVWVPPYHTSIDYVRAGNVAYVSHDVVNNITVNNITVIHNDTKFVNQQHVTVVSQQAFANAQPVQHAAVAVTPAALNRPIVAAATPAKVLPAPTPAAVRPASARPVNAPPPAKLPIAHPITPTNNLPKLAPAGAAPVVAHPAPTSPAGASAIPHPAPAAPPAMAHPAAPPEPQSHAPVPAPAASRPAVPETAHPAAPAAPAPQFHAPAPPPPAAHAPAAPVAPAPQFHAPAPPPPAAHAPAAPVAPAPQFHAPAPPPPAAHAPAAPVAPAPQFHAPAPPPPAAHAPAAPAPQVHAPAPPPPAAHAPAAAPPAAQPAHPGAAPKKDDKDKKDQPH